MKLEGKKAKVIRTVTSVQGALHENEVVLIERWEKNRNGDSHLRCRDNMGRIFYLAESDIKVVDKSN